jgi:hypothetical protein
MRKKIYVLLCIEIHEVYDRAMLLFFFLNNRQGLARPSRMSKAHDSNDNGLNHHKEPGEEEQL